LDMSAIAPSLVRFTREPGPLIERRHAIGQLIEKIDAVIPAVGSQGR